MATPIIEGSDVIISRAINSLKENTQLTRFTPGAKARTLITILATEIDRLEQILSSNMVLGLVSGAGGIYLDFLGDLVGVQRQQKSTAVVTSGDQSVRIFVDEGTFGDLNNGRSITIPAGTLISSADNQIRYTTILDTILLADDTEVFIAARSLRSGPDGNIPRNVLTVLGFTDYAAYPNTLLKVENSSSIQSGVAVEQDDFYRYRIKNALLSAESGNLIAIRLAALSVQSIADVLIMPLYRGIGTLDILLDTVTGAVSDQILESVARAVDRTRSLGIDVLIRRPSLVGLELALDIKMARGLSSADKILVTNTVRDTVSSLIAAVPMGGELSINSISAAVLSSDRRIVDVGAPGRPFSELILWRDSAITGARRPAILRNSNIILGNDERLTLEGQGSQAIRITEI